jgi:hypothetical protein
MRCTVRKSLVRVVGHIWMPNAVCSMVYTLRQYDIDNIKVQAEYDTGSPTIDRDAVEQWLATNSGDFRDILDFDASIEDGDQTIDIPFATEDGELAYYDTLAEPDEVNS